MASLVEYPLNKDKDLGLAPQYPHKKLSVVCAWNPSSGDTKA